MMHLARTVEWISGLAAGTTGVIVIAYVVFGPLYTTVSTDRPQPRSVSLWEMGLAPGTVVFLAAVLLCALGSAYGAYLHGRRHRRAGLIVLWVSAILLWTGALLSMFSIGLFLLPVAILSLIAAVAGSRVQANANEPT